MHEFKRLFSRHMDVNQGKYIIVFILFVAGIVGGIAFSRNVSLELSEDIKNEITILIEGFEGGNVDDFNILRTSFLKNLRFFLLIFIGGLSVWLSPLICAVLISYGFSVGFTFSYLSVNFGWCGAKLAIASLLFTFVISVPIYMILSVIAFNNCLNRRFGRGESGNFGMYILMFGLLFMISLVQVAVDSFLIPGIVASICS